MIEESSIFNHIPERWNKELQSNIAQYLPVANDKIASMTYFFIIFEVFYFVGRLLNLKNWKKTFPEI